MSSSSSAAAAAAALLSSYVPPAEGEFDEELGYVETGALPGTAPVSPRRG